MLVTFTFKNHGPFKDECVFDMRAVPAYKENMSSVAYPFDEGVLKFAAVFGSNASGKSQFVDAYKSYRSMVRMSFGGTRGYPDDYYSPFLFSQASRDAKTEYEGYFATEEGEYRYGFSHDNEKFIEEWLFFTSAHTRRTSTILERGENGLRLGASVRKECQKYVEDISDDTLALSFFGRLALKASVFRQTIACVCSLFPITSRMCTMDIDNRLRSYFKNTFDETEKSRLMSLLSAVDFGITDITVEKTEIGVQVYTHHIGEDGRDYAAPLEIESSGTKKLIALYSYFDRAIMDGEGLIIDETDAQLHPLLLEISG